jgi:hypothetical protein
MKEAEVLIKFDITKLNASQLDRLFLIEDLLGKLGIIFDTGYDGGKRDWEWDFSLKGPVKVYFKKFKDEEVIDACC